MDQITVINEIGAVEARITSWRAAAVAVKSWAAEAHDSHSIEADRLVRVEEIAGEIYHEIDRLNALLRSVSEAVPEAAASLAKTVTGLQLVLMEITEQGTSMYSVASEEGVISAPVVASPASHSVRGGQYEVGYFARKHRIRRDEAREIISQAGDSRDRANQLASVRKR